MTTREETLRDIAQRILCVETLDTRKSDSLDFHDLAVWTLREALEAAFEAGKTASRLVKAQR
jgi:hypothetical protein